MGRTGRAGTTGLALSLVTLNDMGRLGKIEVYQNQPSTFYPLDSLTPTSDAPLLPPMVTVQILGGRKEKIRPGDVLGALTNEEGGPAYTREQIGKIAVTEYSTFVAVAREIGKAACAKLNAGKVKGKSARARVMTLRSLTPLGAWAVRRFAQVKEEPEWRGTRSRALCRLAAEALLVRQIPTSLTASC